MRLDADSLNAVRAARDRALAAGHPKLTALHLLGCLLDNASVQGVVQGAEGSVDQLRSAAASLLERVPAPSLWERVVSAVTQAPIPEGTSYRRALRLTLQHARWTWVDEAVAIDLFVALFRARDELVEGALVKAGLSRRAVLRYHCHGVRPSADVREPVPPGDWSEVIVMNDNYSEMKLVVEVFQRAFGLSPQQAYRLMKQVHREGSAVLGPYSREATARVLQVAGEMVDRAEAPLLMRPRSAAAADPARESRARPTRG